MDLPERVMGRLFALAPRLVEIQDLGAREYGMSYARGRVVAALHALGPVKMRRLSQAVGVTPRTITGLVDALEADGWVVRQADPGDRRATIVALTPAAGSSFAPLLQAYSGPAGRGGAPGHRGIRRRSGTAAQGPAEETLTTMSCLLM